MVLKCIEKNRIKSTDLNMFIYYCKSSFILDLYKCFKYNIVNKTINTNFYFTSLFCNVCNNGISFFTMQL